MEIKDVVLYARVSKANCHQDPELQLQPLRLMCQMKGWRIVHEYVDRGWSGAKESRPRLDELMLDVTKGRRDFQAVLVWKFDRFARSVQHLLKALSTFDENKVAFISHTESVDTSTPMGRLVFTILGAVAEMERSLIQERVKAGVRNADKPGFSRKGNKLGRPVGPAGPNPSTLWRRAQRQQALAAAK
jgi:DNA invertase Pin-like site-specific DNA recombinase